MTARGMETMKELDTFEEIIDIGKKRGKLTYDEIYEAVSPDYVNNDELEEFLDLLQDLGVEVTESSHAESEEAEDAGSEGRYEKTEDLVQAYFRSMGDIAILSRDEETELARKIEEGKNLIEQIVIKLPLDVHMNEGKRGPRNMSLIAKEEQRDVKEKVIGKSLETLDNIMIQDEVEPHGHNKGTITDYLRTKYDRISRARDLVTQAKDQLIIHNLRLVVNIAKHYIGRGGLSFLDLIQEGNIGLMKAIDKFDYRKGFKFSTYATWWIRQAITRALMDQTKTIRIPVHVIELYNKITNATKELTQRLGREPRKEEIANRLSVPVKKIEDVMKAIQEPIAIQTTIGNDETTLEDIIGDDASSPHEDADRNNLTEEMLRVLQTLTPKEEQVIRMRFGIGLDRDHTLEEVGQHLSITRERVRQIEAKAMRKLKHPNRLRALKVLNSGS